MGVAVGVPRVLGDALILGTAATAAGEIGDPLGFVHRASVTAAGRRQWSAPVGDPSSWRQVPTALSCRPKASALASNTRRRRSGVWDACCSLGDRG